MASDFSSSGSDWARQILQLPQSSWPTNTSIGFPDWARAMRVTDDAAAVVSPPTIRDRLLNILILSSGNQFHAIYYARRAEAAKERSPPCDRCDIGDTVAAPRGEIIWL